MSLSTESLLVILFVGIVAGWLAGKVVRGSGFGLLGDLVIGVVGAFIASLLFPRHPARHRAHLRDRLLGARCDHPAADRRPLPSPATLSPPQHHLDQRSRAGAVRLDPRAHRPHGTVPPGRALSVHLEWRC